jgi:hypothetical protein
LGGFFNQLTMISVPIIRKVAELSDFFTIVFNSNNDQVIKKSILLFKAVLRKSEERSASFFAKVFNGVFLGSADYTLQPHI